MIRLRRQPPWSGVLSSHRYFSMLPELRVLEMHINSHRLITALAQGRLQAEGKLGKLPQFCGPKTVRKATSMVD